MTSQPTSTPIPVVSFAPFLTGDRSDQKAVARQVYDAFSNVGFIYLRDHGIASKKVDEIFQLVSWLSIFACSGF